MANIAIKQSVNQIQYDVIKSSQDVIYNILLVVFIVANIIACFGVFSMGASRMILAFHLLSALIAFWVYTKRSKFKNFIIYFVHSIIVIHAIIGVWYYGWGFGIENFLIWSICVNYFAIAKKYYFALFVIILEAFCYILLYANKETLGIPVIDESLKGTLNILSFIFIFLSFFTRNLIISDAHFLNLKGIIGKNELVRQNARYDYLTGLRNRVGVEEIITHMLNSTQYKFVMLAIGDIDNFKHINDTFGHVQGDKVLKSIATIIKDGFRGDEDLVCRWGGEEFLIASFLNHDEGADAMLGRILDNINTLKTPDEKSLGMTFGVVLINTSVSFKIDVKSAIKMADDLLYRGKNEGKNRIKTKICNEI